MDFFDIIGITQLMEWGNKIFSSETSYSESELTFAKFCLNNANFNLNLPYKISAIAKRVPAAIPPNARETENSILRDLETTDFRIIE